MAAFTLQQAQEQLNAYLAAEVAVLGSQQYEIAGRKLTRANLSEIQTGVSVWAKRVAELTVVARGRGRSRTIVPGG